MMLFVIILLLVYACQIYFDARWDAEILTPGKSNHTFKSLELICILSVAGLFGIIGHELWPEYLWLLKLIILAFIYPFLRYLEYDYILSHYWYKYPSDEVDSGLWKLLSGIIVIFLTILFKLI